MRRDPKYDILFEPIRIGPKTMENRFYQTPHCTGLGTDFPGAHAHFRGVKAEGGWGAVNTEYCSVHPESDDRPWSSARLWDERDVRNLALMVEKVHEHGALAGVELWYGACHATNHESRLASRGPSALPSDLSWMHSCYEMDKQEIRELQAAYVAAAKRARSAGFDIVNVHGAEVGSITQQFLMSFYNKRTDEYGGPLENRARFWLETIEQVKEAVGDDCAIAVRFCVDTLDDSEDGIRAGEEGVGFVQLADHLVDLWDLQAGGWMSPRFGVDAGPSRFHGEDFQAPWVSQVRPYATKPVVGVGRFTNPDTMAAVIKSGQLDIIGAARPSIADPFLPKKIEEGRLDDIRECIGSNICASRFNIGTRIVCTQNATSGEEYRRDWHPERFTRAANANLDVLVVGAGPAGMECARVLGERGMQRVHLVDESPELGGHLQWLTRLPGLGEWARVTAYRRIQLNKLPNVQFVPGTRLGPDDVLEYGADLVVVSTGSVWSGDGLNGVTRGPLPGADASLPHVLTPEQLVHEEKEVPGDRVAVYDCDGYVLGVSLAERLAKAGKQVTLVTPHAGPAPYTGYTGEIFGIARTLAELDIDVRAGHVVTALTESSVQAQAGTDRVEIPVDGVVLVTQRIARDGLYRHLNADADALASAGIKGLFRIGDCLVPRLLADAVFDGHRLGREIDTPAPAVAKPYIRENRVLGSTDEEYDAVLESREPVGL